MLAPTGGGLQLQMQKSNVWQSYGDAALKEIDAALLQRQRP